MAPGSGAIDGILNQVVSTTETVGGADTITGDDGNDSILGGADNDTISGNLGTDLILGDSGQLDYTGGDLRTIASTASGVGGADTITGDDGGDTIVGGAAGDTIHGNLGDDLILGDEGTITLENGIRKLITSTNTGTSPFWTIGATVVGKPAATVITSSPGLSCSSPSVGDVKVLSASRFADEPEFVRTALRRLSVLANRDSNFPAIVPDAIFRSSAAATSASRSSASSTAPEDRIGVSPGMNGAVPGDWASW